MITFAKQDVQWIKVRKGQSNLAFTSKQRTPLGLTK